MKNDDYQFPKDEYLEHSDATHDETPEQPPAGGGGRFSLLKNRKFVTGLLIFIVIIIGLKIMHHPAAPVAPPAPVMPQVPASFVAPVQNTMPSSDISTMQSQLSALHSQVNSMAAANAQLTQSVSALTTQVANMATAMQSTSQQLMAMTMKSHVMKKSLYRPAPIIYVIKAMVPGRVWLMGSNGVSINVAVGNYISPYYGAVQSIDATNGQLMTTRGKMITYGSNDS